MTGALPKTSTYTDPNKAQREASDPKACVWVNASAGSGKTSVLTKRVLRLLLQNVRPQKLLCLTYTRAGAAEMSNRVTESLKKWAVCDDNALSGDIANLQDAPATKDQMRDARKLFAKVLACPGGLRIRTIHSFCQEILSRFPLEAGLPPHFSLIENQELDVLNSDVLDGLLREAVEQPGSDIAKAFRVLAEAQGEHKFADVLEQVMHNRGHLSKALAKAGSIEALQANVLDAFSLKPSDTPDNIKCIAVAHVPIGDIKMIAAGAMKGTANQAKKGEALLAYIAKSEPERIAAFDEYVSLLVTQKMDPQPRLVPVDISRQQPELLDVHKNEVERLKSILAKLEAAETCATTCSVLQFGLAFAKRLAQRKASRAQLDYEDLILSTENLLRRQNIAGWVQYKLDQGIDHILVDEAQDTSNAQWNIVNSLIDGYEKDDSRTLFVVGDEKQSIFSFQNADPEAFLSHRASFTGRLADAGKALRNIQMNTSFRSAKAVLDAVDAVFAQPEALQGVSQQPIAHQPTRNEDGSEKIGRVEIWPLVQKEKDLNGSNEWYVPGDYEDETDPEVELAQQIARKIKGWIVRRDFLPGENRPISPGDIMILLRRRGRFADLMVRALKKNDVPVTGVDRMHLVQELPILDLLSMIRFVLLPEDDLNLAELLRSPLIGFSEEQMMAIAIHREGSLWESLKRNAACQNVTDYLSKRLAEADYSTPLDFLSRTLNAPCPADTDSGRKALWSRLGKEALDPIDELLNAAETFGQNHAPSLQNFLRWLTQTDTEIRRELDHSEGQVRILTVHASKGLEAPIVFLPDTAAVPRTQDVKNFQWADDETPVFFPHMPKFEPGLRLWKRARDKQMEEYRRLFYVAMTRASRRLYICGWTGKDTASEGSWYNLALSGLKEMHKAHIAPDADGPAPLVIYADTFTPQSSQEIGEAAPADIEPLPSWARVPITEKPISVATTPSRGEDGGATPDAAFARGRIIHRLLQSLPDIEPQKRDEAIKRFLAHPRHGLSDETRSDIAGEVGDLIHNDAFQTLFGPDSLAEAPVAGRIDGANVFRQVDRLCLRGNEVWIVDYKTNRPPPTDAKDIPAIYREQLAQYKTLLSGIYPNMTVRCFLLWTYRPRLMEVAV